MPIGLWGENAGKFCLTDTEERMLKIIKCRRKTDCCMCGKKISPKSFCLGTGYQKICLSCYEKFLNTFKKSMEDYSVQANNLIAEIKGKEQMMIKNNILSRVEDKDD